MDKLKICNLALMLVGIPPITSLDGENNNARLCQTFFPIIRDRVLRDHPWSFATTFYDLQALHETSPDPRFPKVCLLPGDVVRIISLEPDRPYRKVGNNILVEELPARLCYTRSVEDSNLYDSTFIEAVQYLLAAEIGLANTRDAQLISMFRQEYERRLAVARSIDSSENRFEHQNGPRRSGWLGARRSAWNERGFAGPIRWTAGNAGIQGEE